MSSEKYNRSLSLICPVCGGDQFEFDDCEETANIYKCPSCKREFTRELLIEENSENISEHVKEIGDEVAKDVAKELRATLQKAFSGSGSIRFK